MIRHDLPEDLRGMSPGVLMRVLDIDPMPRRTPVERPAWFPDHLFLDPFAPEQADAWLTAVQKHEGSR